jgi:arginine utilization protein RocB
MDNMKTLANQLREQMVKPVEKGVPINHTEVKDKQSLKAKKTTFPILDQLIAFDNSANKSLVHVRFDSRTADTMNKFKMATNIDVTKFVAFAVKELFDNHPELKTIIKLYIQNTEL